VVFQSSAWMLPASRCSRCTSSTRAYLLLLLFVIEHRARWGTRERCASTASRVMVLIRDETRPR